jgi:type II restriction enzyme
MDKDAKAKLDTLIKKSRVHFYKPIQIAEILYFDRIGKHEIALDDLETYRTRSKKWRDEISNEFIGRASTSSARYQDDLFAKTAIPPDTLKILGTINKKGNGLVENYIYLKLQNKIKTVEKALNYCLNNDKDHFKLEDFIDAFESEAGLKRSLDKIFEIVVYALFEAITTSLKVKVNIVIPDESEGLMEAFPEFCEKVLQLNSKNKKVSLDAHFNRVGVTNAADRGLDMYANFGSVVQIKHLDLSLPLACEISETVTSNKIIIVCKKAEEPMITSILSQVGWGGRIQSIITMEALNEWYERAMKGPYSDVLGELVLSLLADEIGNEFPMLGKASGFKNFRNNRGYTNTISDQLWG